MAAPVQCLGVLLLAAAVGAGDFLPAPAAYSAPRGFSHAAPYGPPPPPPTHAHHAPSRGAACGGCGGGGGGGGGGVHGGYEQPKAYQFGYAVRDYASGNDYQRHERSDGNTVTGEYRVQLPDGRTQVVSYTADWQHGFRAKVSYEGEARHPPPPPPPPARSAYSGGSSYAPPPAGRAPFAAYAPRGYH